LVLRSHLVGCRSGGVGRSKSPLFASENKQVVVKDLQNY
jgi:hypothetical protein